MEQIFRQGEVCAGCQRAKQLTPAPTGLYLCNDCHTIMALSFNDSMVLRRLMAGLDYKKDKYNIYLIGSLKNRQIMDLANELRSFDARFDVHDEWITPGPNADDYWQEYETNRGRKWAEALRSRGCTNIYQFDKAYMDLADSVILVLPAGKSGMCELGYAAGKSIHTGIFLNDHEPERYEVMPNFADDIIQNVDDLKTLLKGKADAIFSSGSQRSKTIHRLSV